MKRTALLIGSQTGELEGVGHDVAAMSKALALWDFDPIRLENENASRAGILDAYDRLIDQAGDDDAVVVYYSGHGGYAADSERGYGTPGNGTIQFIEPTDIDASTEGDFRGITAAELSVLLVRLTERTQNVTVVMDCCHAANMTRDPDRRARSRSRPVSMSLLRSHASDLRRDGLRVDLWNPLGNPHAVRVVACALDQLAFESTNSDGFVMGYLTSALTTALIELKTAGLRVSWDTVMDRVRQGVLDRWPTQRPEVEGPGQRIVFDLAESDLAVTMPLTVEGDRARIPGAPLFGIRRGDEFLVVPDDSIDLDDTRTLGGVRIDAVDGQAAYGLFTARHPDAEVTIAARAYPVRTSLPKLPVHVPHGDSRLTEAIAQAPLMRIADEEESASLSVRVDDTGRIAIHDESGELSRGLEPNALNTTKLVGDLSRVAKARALRRLTPEPGLALPTPVSIEFARVVNGAAVPLPRTGAAIHSRQPICVRVRNDGDDPVYVSLLDVGVSAKITVLNPSTPGGIRIGGQREYIWGGNDLTGALPGLVVSWPETVPGRYPRTETIVVLVSEEPIDTRALVQQGFRGSGRSSRLELHLATLRTGASREVAAEPGRPVRFAVHTIDFDLMPIPVPPDETVQFQVDDRGSAEPARGRPDLPTDHVVLRLTDLVAHHFRMWRCADIRFDIVAVTHDEHGEPMFHVHTERFHSVEDGVLLPIHSPVYDGSARDNLDVAVWASPDTGAPLDLAEELKGSISTAATQVPDLINATHRLLSQAYGDVVGLYRTVLLATERFGAARLQADTAVAAKDFSFRWTAETAPAPVRQ